MSLQPPYGPGVTYSTSETTSKCGLTPQRIEATLNVKAEDIASSDLLVVANLMTAMKETLGRMTQAFEALGEQSQRLSSLPCAVRRADDMRMAKVELEEQIARQKSRIQEIRSRLEGDVKIAMENKLRERLARMIQESVAEEVVERVRRELAVQAPLWLREEFKPASNSQPDNGSIQHEDGYHSDPDTPLLSPEDIRSGRPNIPIFLFHGPTDDEEDDTRLRDGLGTKTELSSPVFFHDHDSYPPVRMPILLFDESREHEPPPPSPAPMAGPLRPFLRPLPSPDQSPTYVVCDTLPSRSASSCATPVTAYPRVPAPTPITNEPILMVYPLRNAPASALSPVSEVTSPLAPRDHNLLFALSSERNRELFRNQDLDGFVVPTPMAEWPKTRTILKTPARTLRSSPLMVPPLVEPKVVKNTSRIDNTSPESPMFLVPPPRPELRGRSSSLANNLKLLPPLIIA